MFCNVISLLVFPLNPYKYRGVKIIKIPSLFVEKEEKNCKDSCIGQDLTEFVKIHMLKFLQFFFIKKCYFGNFDMV